MIKIDFERGQDPWLYRDALHLTPEQHAAMTPEEIEAMKDARYQAWYAMVTNPPPPEPAPEYIEIDGVKYVKA